jgi:hypothetical protein
VSRSSQIHELRKLILDPVILKRPASTIFVLGEKGMWTLRHMGYKEREGCLDDDESWDIMVGI